MPGMDPIELARLRLHRQHLAGPVAADPVAVVAGLGAVQAQEFAVAKWSLGQRTTGYDDAAVQRLLDEGALIRTHALRPTWHFLAAADLAWVQRLTGPRVHVLNGHYYRLHGLDAQTDRITYRIFEDVLAGGRHLTRAELAVALEQGGFPATGNRLAYVVIRAELDGLLVSGARRGKQHTYALASERLPGLPAAPELSGDAALAELTRRYFTGHGPATVKDFAWWSSLTLTQIRRGLELAGAALTSALVAGREYWFGATELPDGGRPTPRAQVLQGYDEYVVAYTESRDLANIAGTAFPPTGSNTLVHAIVLDSQLVARWRREPGPRGIVVRPLPGRTLRASERTLVEHEFARHGAFFGAPVTIAWP